MVKSASELKSIDKRIKDLEEIRKDNAELSTWLLSGYKDWIKAEPDARIKDITKEIKKEFDIAFSRFKNIYERIEKLDKTYKEKIENLKKKLKY